MLDTKGLMRIIDRGFLLKALYLALLYSLVPVGEIAFILYLRSFFGSYLLVAAVLFTGLFGVAVTWKLISSSLRALGARVRSGSYPDEEFALLAGSLITGLFLVTPGFITDVIGLLFVLPVIRRSGGGAIAMRMEGRLKELYEYMKL
jgi:UPF0716 protein FxsA